MEEGDIQEVFNSHLSELTNGGLEELRLLTEPKREEDSHCFGETSADYQYSQEEPVDGR